MTRSELIKSGYSVYSKKTGVEYPNYAPTLGVGWQFILSAPGQPDRRFTCHKMAWAFAGRIAAQTGD